MNILIVDDDELIRGSLNSKLKSFYTIKEAQNGKIAIEIVAKHNIDLILMDIRMPILDGIEATFQIKEKSPKIKILMLTTFEDKQNIEKAITAGADGYMLKTDINEIIAKVKLSLGTSLLQKILTERENDIAKLVANGLNNKEIAEKLFLSEGTIRNNIVVIMEKLNVANRTQLALKYLGV
ncbi:MAG: response regulator transcription factor [Defluviitaleaceae bacterium]|nr:response regulator transcription factor [Defluviitaleaceae bacterium]